MNSSRSSISRSFSALLLSALTTACIAQGSQSSQQAQEPAETLHASTQLVIVDVVVEDKSGHAIHGLTRENFVLTEQKKAQTVRNFEEHSATSNQKPTPPAPKLPPGVFTDYTPVAPDNTLNVLLVDALNTEQKDQIYLRQQLLDYIKREKPGTNVAIFGLANRLVMLQGFTTDPAVLRAVVQQQHFNSKGSALLNDPNGTGVGPQSLSEATQDHPQAHIDAQVLANLQQWEAEQAALKTHMRAQFTLDAFDSLAHYLSNFPGRKNLIWFSGSFPLQIEPDPTIKDAFGVVADSNSELRETTNLLSAAETSVYPVDARGLITAPVFDASQSGKRVTMAQARRGDSDAYSTGELKFGQSQADEHITMEAMADQTGGHAFYNTNNLTDAVASAIDAGSNYYTLSYTPTDHKWNSAYRNIHVEITGSAEGQVGKLAYRHGYYADNPQRPPKLERGEAKAAPGTPMAANTADAYSRTAIGRGSPTPQDIVFKVRVLPLTGKDDDTLAPDNQADPHGRMKGPYRTFTVDYVALPGGFTMVPQSDGRHTGAIEFGIFVYDSEGNLLNVSDKQVSLNLPPDAYKEFKSNPVRLQLQVSAPVKQESFMRLIIHDIPSNHYGAVEIPTAEVGHLPPLEAQNTPAGGAAPSSGATPRPGEKQ